MTIFIAHAPQDLEVAEGLARTLERRGWFVELEDGERPGRPLGPMDAVVMLVSKDSVFSPWRLRLEARALEAWADGRLKLVKLDHHFAPVGLRDLPFIDASFEAQREFTWAQLVRELQDVLRPPAAAAPAPQAPEAAPPDAAREARKPARKVAPPTRTPDIEVKERRAAPAKRGGLGWVWALLGVVLLAGLAAGALFLAPPQGPAGDAQTLGLGLPWWVLAAIAFAGLIVVWVIGFVASLLAGLGRRRRSKASPAPRQAREEAAAPHEAPATGGLAAPKVFVSYARANAELVRPVVADVQGAGVTVWIDAAEIAAGDGWAGEIVRAIKAAGNVVVMCSSAAFQSDHVKREVYLADRYKKRLLPVFLEPTDPPEDFEYFFAGVQHLKLHEVAQGERGAMLLKALG